MALAETHLRGIGKELKQVAMNRVFRKFLYQAPPRTGKTAFV